MAREVVEWREVRIETGRRSRGYLS